jgi:plasmid maintenance system antidote protein VapI
MAEPLKHLIERRLRELNRSPIEAAQIGGLERSYINDIIRGSKRSVSEDRLPQVAKALDWALEDFLRARGLIGDSRRA